MVLGSTILIGLLLLYCVTLQLNMRYNQSYGIGMLVVADPYNFWFIGVALIYQLPLGNRQPMWPMPPIVFVSTCFVLASSQLERTYFSVGEL